MRISQIHLQNFKRFTDLKISLGEESPKLILLIGANGSGKSGVFDAFEFVSKYSVSVQHRGWQKGKVEEYYLKKGDVSKVELIFSDKSYYRSTINDSHDAGIFDSNANLTERSFYGRSAIRYLPRITRTVLGETIDITQNKDKPSYYIDVDSRFENDIDVVIKRLVEQVFKGIYDSSQELQQVRSFLERINNAIVRVFGDENATSLKFLRPVPPADGQTSQLVFSKGNSEITYDLLSSGEKEVVNILFNLFVRTPIYQNSIYFFDELDAHLHTSLQYNLLKEIVENWIPDNCQIWTATHSLGFIQYAQTSDSAAIIDLDNHDFDLPIALTPQKNQEIFDIAVPKEALTVLFKDKKLIFCENENAALFNLIGAKNTLFLGDIDKTTITLRVEKDKSIYGLIDRDFLSDDERQKLLHKFQNLRILEYYCFENYLYHPQNLKELYTTLNIENYISAIKRVKNESKNRIIQKLDSDRKSYSFYKKNFLPYQNEEFDAVVAMLESDDFETFYKVFSMKKRGDICKIPNLRHQQLVKTQWFKSKIETIIQQ